jgi:hypothetical protein
MRPKDFFILAVRILGLYFFYKGLRDLDVPALLDVTFINIDKTADIVSAILPAIFNLSVAWWLLGNKFLIRRAYPESLKNPSCGCSSEKNAAPQSSSSQPQKMTPLEGAEAKLASLVVKG